VRLALGMQRFTPPPGEALRSPDRLDLVHLVPFGDRRKAHNLHPSCASTWRTRSSSCSRCMMITMAPWRLSLSLLYRVLSNQSLVSVDAHLRAPPLVSRDHRSGSCRLLVRSISRHWKSRAGTRRRYSETRRPRGGARRAGSEKASGTSLIMMLRHSRASLSASS
jgi:hypothetical protein